MKKTYNYPEHIIEAIQNWYEENDQMTLTEEDVKKMDPILVLDIYLEWEGIMGYTHDIISIMCARHN